MKLFDPYSMLEYFDAKLHSSTLTADTLMYQDIVERLKNNIDIELQAKHRNEYKESKKRKEMDTINFHRHRVTARYCRTNNKQK